MNYPERIESLALQIAAKTREVQEFREQIGLRESAATLQVLNAKDEEGRPLYSNETARSAAIKLALAGNTRYQESSRRLVAAEQERAQLLANIERARNDFKMHLLERQQEIATMHPE